MATKKEKTLVKVNTDLTLPQDLIPELEQSPSLQEIDQEDRMTPYYCFNVKLTDPEGNWYPKEVFFHTLREDARSELNCVLLFLHKTNRYRIVECPELHIEMKTGRVDAAAGCDVREGGR